MKYFISIFLSILILVPVCSFAQGMVLNNVILNTTDRYMTLHISLTFLNEKKIENILKKKAVEVAFKGNIKIEKDRMWFFDKTIYTKEISATIIYDPIKNEYIVHKKNKDVFRNGSIKKVLKYLSNITLNIPLWTHPKGRDNCRVILKFYLKKNVPYWIEKSLFFWNFNLIPPVEYSIDFKF